MKQHLYLITLIPLILSSCTAMPDTSIVSSSQSVNPSSVIPSSEESIIISSKTPISSDESVVDGSEIIHSSEESIISSSKQIPSSESTTPSSLESIISSEIIPSSASSSSKEEIPTLNPLNEPYINKQYYLNHIGDIYNTWNYYRGKGITIAVIDLGFKPDHEDFTFQDGTSKVSDLSASFTTTGNTTTTLVGKDKVVNLGESHGSFCAGVAAAGLNGKGVIGIAPEASLLLLKTDAKPKSIEKAFRYAADNGAKVITISIGSYYNYGSDLINDGSNLSTVFNDAIIYCRNKGTVVISAGGNGGMEGKATEYTYPGATPNVIGVGGIAANKTGEVWSGSSYNYSKSTQFCDVFAPAEGMFGVCHYNGKLYDGGWQGTSFASPIVAGMAALYFEKNPNNTVDQFEMDLYASSHLMYYNKSSARYGNGYVDVGKLLNTNANQNITIKVDYNGSTLYCYAWNLLKEKEKASWPGTKLNKVNGYYQITVNPSDYDSIIFNNGSDNFKTIDMTTSSFINGNIYKLTNAYTDTTCGAKIGSFIKN